MLFRRRVIGSINISNNAIITCTSKTYNGQTHYYKRMPESDWIEITKVEYDHLQNEQ